MMIVTVIRDRIEVKSKVIGEEIYILVFRRVGGKSVVVGGGV